MHARWLVAVLIATSTPAHAWQIESVATSNCHERITAHALARTGFPDGALPPAPSEYEQRIIADVPFSFPQGIKDGWRVALLIGVRDNDIGKFDPTDVAALSVIHNDPERQDEHCLRHREDDGLAGNAAAKQRCKAFILEQFALALGDDDTVDMAAEVTVEVNLKFRNRIELRLNRFAFHTGRALHAVQDSYTHMFRAPETGNIRTVLNWVDGNLGGSAYDEERDGHEHIGSIDDCSLTDREARIRMDHAELTSALLLAALVDGTGGRAGRLARAAAVIDVAFVEDPDCTLANDYCGASELVMSNCSVGGAAGAATLLLVGLATLLALRRRTAAVVLALVASPPLAHADADEAVKAADKADEKRQLAREDQVMAELPDPTTQTWGVALSLGGAFDRGGAAASLGVRYNPVKSFGTGLDVEWNPWISYSELDAVAGAANIYVPLIWKVRTFGSWELRSTFAVGASVLLTNIVEGNRGSVGVYAGWNPLGVAVTVHPNWKLVVKPGDIAVPVPELENFPFYYHQYRLSIGLEWYP